jgi:chromatin modification-related protein YNG2
VYCYCRNVSYGEMIGCDNEQCQYEWFHLDCVGLAEPPRGVWFCPDCLAEGANRSME